MNAFEHVRLQNQPLLSSSNK